MAETYRVVQIEQLDGVKMRTTLAENLSQEMASRTVATCSAQLADTLNPGATIIKAEPEEPPTADGTIKIGVTIQLGGSEAEDICGFHDEARERYSKWTQTLVEWTKEYGTAKTEVAEREQKMENIVASWLRTEVENRGDLNYISVFAGCKNERERDAIITGTKEIDQSYRVEHEGWEKARRRLLVEIEPGLEEAKYLRRLAEEDLKWCAATLSTLSGMVEGARHER